MVLDELLGRKIIEVTQFGLHHDWNIPYRLFNSPLWNAIQ